MRLDQALARIGAQIVKQELNGHRLTVFIRANLAGHHYERWKAAVEELILAHAGAKERGDAGWGLDVSRYYYPVSGAVKYLWRIVVVGSSEEDVHAGVEAFVNAVIRSVASSVEVTSMPLVGQIQYASDPANGKIKGGYGLREAQTVMAKARSGGEP